MAESTFWWILAAAAVGLELATGTFYLLMFALGLCAAALAAHAGASSTVQLLAVSAVGSVAVVAWHLKRRRSLADPEAGLTSGMSLDMGAIVEVDHWEADGTALVCYRGSQWKVVAALGTPQGLGAYRVCGVVGSRLVVEKT